MQNKLKLGYFGATHYRLVPLHLPNFIRSRSDFLKKFCKSQNMKTESNLCCFFLFAFSIYYYTIKKFLVHLSHCLSLWLRHILSYSFNILLNHKLITFETLASLVFSFVIELEKQF